MTPAHSPAVNHPSQRIAGFAATHSIASAHFTTDAVAHGTETTAGVARGATVMPASGVRSVASAVRTALSTITYVPAGTTGYLGSAPSYEKNANGSYTYTGVTGSGTAVTAGTLQGAILQWNAKNPNLATSPADAKATTTTTTTPAAAAAAAVAPFDTLSTLLSSLAASTAPVAASGAADSPGTSIPTQSGPSLVIPLMLILLAAGIGYWYFTKHKKGAAAGAHKPA